MRCTRCGEAALDEEGRFCVGCGAPLEPGSRSHNRPDPVDFGTEKEEEIRPVPVPKAPRAPRVVEPRRTSSTLLPEWIVITGVAGILLLLLILIVVTW